MRRARVQILEASSAFQVMVLAAAIDSGALGAPDTRLLLLSTNSEVPEIARGLVGDAVLAPLLERFDRVASYNELIAPLHPSGWRPRAEDEPLFERTFRQQLGIPQDAVVDLVLESVHVPPARSILHVFATASATVYAEGLMSYGPTRDPLRPEAAARIERLLHLDLVPGLAPLLLTEHAVPAEVIAEDAFRAVVASVELSAPEALPEEPYALVLGQYLASLGLLTASAEADLAADLVEAAATAGHGVVVLKPHPSAPPAYLERVRARAAAAGVRLVVSSERAPAEVLFARRPPGLVLGCFSTALVTATRYWGVPAASKGARPVLTALPKTEDSNRMPLVLVDRTVPFVEDGSVRPPRSSGQEELARVVDAVGYAMQWRSHDALRAGAAATVEAMPDEMAAYIPRSRLRQLALPGGWPASLSSERFRGAAGTLVAVRRRQVALEALLGRGRPVPPPSDV